MRLIDADELAKVKFHALPYTHITPSDLTKMQTEAYERGWNDAIDAIIENAETIEPQQWIPVTERLPKENKPVLVTHYGKYQAFVSVDWIDPYTSEWNRTCNVTAWMPLPEPWKGEDDADNNQI